MQHLLQYPLLHLKDSDGKQAIHKAVWNHPKPDIVDLLLKAGADPNAKNKYDYTPLHWAAKHGHLESGKLLISKNASLEIANANGDFFLDLAIRWGQDNFVAHFIGIAPPEEASPGQDLEIYACSKLLQARKQEKTEEQIFYFQKLADICLQKQDWTQAAKLINGALALCNNRSLKNYLLSKVERIEGFFLESLHLKVNTRGRVAHYREKIQNIRTTCFTAFKEGKPAHGTLPSVLKGEEKSAYEILTSITISYKNLLSELILDSQEILGPPLAHGPAWE